MQGLAYSCHFIDCCSCYVLACMGRISYVCSIWLEMVLGGFYCSTSVLGSAFYAVFPALHGYYAVYKKGIENKQGLIYGNDVFVSFAKMLTCFEDIIKNAELIEIHKDRYVNTPRENTNLKKIYVLISAFKDNEEIIPVKLEIKELQ